MLFKIGSRDGIGIICIDFWPHICLISSVWHHWWRSSHLLGHPWALVHPFCTALLLFRTYEWERRAKCRWTRELLWTIPEYYHLQSARNLFTPKIGFLQLVHLPPSNPCELSLLRIIVQFNKFLSIFQQFFIQKHRTFGRFDLSLLAVKQFKHCSHYPGTNEDIMPKNTPKPKEIWFVVSEKEKENLIYCFRKRKWYNSF